MYGTAAGVAARIPGMGVGAISTPDNSQVETWLSQGYALINRKLAAAGYATPVSSGAALYPELVALEEQYAAAHALRARGLDTMTGTGEMRSEVWLREVTAQLADLVRGDLTGSGATQATVTGARPQGVRSVQVRRIDGYSRNVGSYSTTTVPSE